MTEYYFLTSLLPLLEIGHVPPLNFFELKELLRVNLTKEDLETTRRFLRLLDLENMRSLWAQEPLDPRGNLDRESLEQAIENQAYPSGEEFPNYLQEFLEKYPTAEVRIEKFPLLIGEFLEKESRHEKNPFLNAYFNFERQFRLVITGFRAKKLGRNLEHELQWEDPNDPIVAQILAQKDAKSYEPPFEFKELKPIFDNYADHPLELHKALVEYHFNVIQEITDGAIFSLDRILGYMARLISVERWLALDVQQGINVIDAIEGNVK